MDNTKFVVRCKSKDIKACLDTVAEIRKLHPHVEIVVEVECGGQDSSTISM